MGAGVEGGTPTPKEPAIEKETKETDEGSQSPSAAPGKLFRERCNHLAAFSPYE